MIDKSGAVAALRAGTAADHQRLDGLFAGFDLADPASYRAFLTAHARALPAVEHALDAAGFAERLPDWAERHRTAALTGDLAGVGTEPPEPLPFPTPADAAAAWGAAYVVEGSRLGGKFLAQRVGEGLPKAYLATPQPPGAWRDFLHRLDEAVRTPEEIAAATASANAVFALFEAAGREQIAALGR
jgi:heme oxygenase (biliverdin-IX-beta and delta-forming)